MSTKHLVGFALRGKRVRPDSIGMAELGDLLRHLEIAVKASMSPEDRINQAESSEPIMSLTSIREGDSSDMQMFVADPAVPYLRSITEAIANSSFYHVSLQTQDELYKISKWVSNRGISLEFDENKDLGIRHAVISRKHPVPSPAKAQRQFDGPTTLYGYLLRVGGKKPRAALQFPDGTKLVLRSDEVVAKALGERLYENVGIEGVATWRLPDWRLISFKPLRITEYSPHRMTLTQSFKELADASKGRWDGVEAAKYVDEIRGNQAQ